MYLFTMCALSVFAVLGAVTLAKELLFGKPHTDEVTLFTCNNENDIEYTIRCAKHQFPGSDITVIDCGSKDDTAVIAKKLGAKITS